jgi:hypothetical protein
MFDKIIGTFSKIFSLGEFILNLEEEEFDNVLRQLDTANRNSEYNQWSDIDE